MVSREALFTIGLLIFLLYANFKDQILGFLHPYLDRFIKKDAPKRQNKIAGEQPKDLGIPMPNLNRFSFIYGFDKTPINYSNPTVIVAFGTHCGPCKALIPKHIEYAKEFKGALNYITVSNEEETIVSDYCEANNLLGKYSVAVSPNGTLTELMDRCDVSSIPHAFIFNSNGKMTWHGHPGSSEYKKQLLKVINKGTRSSSSVSDQIGWAVKKGHILE